MSWMPDKDPVLGDKQSCDALDLVIVPRVRDLGDGFTVRRALPHGRRQMVGPFIFFDHFGPVTLMAGQGMDVRPHPHIGMATVTYLFDGTTMHRDSMGNVSDLVPGELNLMTAGRGIAHSERTPPKARAEGGKIFGLQTWVALPEPLEETAPGFQHFDAGKLPVVEDKGLWARVITGSSFGKTAPAKTLSDWFYVEVVLEAGATAPLDADYEERGVYVVEGEIEISGERFEAPKLLVFKPGDRITLKATQKSRIMYLGGAALEGPRHIWWNFVSSRRERIEEAKEAWRSGTFPQVPGETEFIPLPDQ